MLFRSKIDVTILALVMGMTTAISRKKRTKKMVIPQLLVIRRWLDDAPSVPLIIRFSSSHSKFPPHVIFELMVFTTCL